MTVALLILYNSHTLLRGKEDDDGFFAGTAWLNPAKTSSQSAKTTFQLWPTVTVHCAVAVHCGGGKGVGNIRFQ